MNEVLRPVFAWCILNLEVAMAKNSRADDRKFRELILHVARESEQDEHFGATKLNKILFYSDFWAYRKLGQSITGQQYQKLDKGPAPRRLLPIVRKMEARGDCVLAEREYFGRLQKILLALREPDLSLFSGAEIAIVHQVLERLRGLSATEVSELSHQFIGWQLAEEGEDIPYSTALLGQPRPPTPAEIEYGKKLAEELGG
jgi:uncharacterized phage-associated protein